jgi:hypothetical protein
MKKIIAAAALGAIALTSAGVASAASIKWVKDESAAKIKYDSYFKADADVTQKAYIVNGAASGSNSGGNTVVSADDQKGTSIYTGDAGAITEVSNKANSSDVTIKSKGSCGCDDEIKGIDDSSEASIKHEETTKEEADAYQKVEAATVAGAVSDTGNNGVLSGDSLKGTTVTSGEALSATEIKNKFNKSNVWLKKSSF